MRTLTKDIAKCEYIRDRFGGVSIGLPVPGDKVSLCALPQTIRGNIDAKSELGVKERRNLTRASYMVVPIPSLKTSYDFDVRTFKFRKWLIIVKSGIELFCVKLFPSWNVGQDWTIKLLYCNIPNCGDTFELEKLVKENAKTRQTFPDHLQNLHEF